MGRHPNDWMSAPPNGFITAPPMPAQAMAMPIARPAFFLNQLPIMTGAGSRNANAAATPSTAPATYHCHTALNCPMDANASAAATMPTLTSTRMLTFGNSFPATGSAAVMHKPWIVKYSMKLPCENCRSPSTAGTMMPAALLMVPMPPACRKQQAMRMSHAGCNRRERRSPPVWFVVCCRMRILPSPLWGRQAFERFRLKDAPFNHGTDAAEADRWRA